MWARGALVTEAELTAATQNMLFSMRVMKWIGLKLQKPMTFEVDNEGAMKDLTCNWSVGGRARHASVREGAQFCVQIPFSMLELPTPTPS